MEQKIDLDALEAALAKSTPGEWRIWKEHFSVHAGIIENTPSRLRTAKNGGQICDCEDSQDSLARNRANARLICLAHNALPALIAELRELRARVTPEVIGEKHRDGNWWMVWEPDYEQWFKCRWMMGSWRISGTVSDRLYGTPTHALPILPAPEGPDATPR